MPASTFWLVPLVPPMCPPVAGAAERSAPHRRAAEPTVRVQGPVGRHRLGAFRALKPAHSVIDQLEPGERRQTKRPPEQGESNAHHCPSKLQSHDWSVGQNEEGH